MGKIERKCHTSLHSFRISFKWHWGSSNRFSKRHVLKHLERHFVRPLWGCLLISSLPNIGYVHTVSAYNEQFVLHTTRFIQHISTKFGIYKKKVLNSYTKISTREINANIHAQYHSLFVILSVLLFLKVLLSFFIRMILLFSLSASFPWRDWFLLHLPLWTVFLSYQIRPLQINFFSHCVNIHWALCFFKCHGWSLPIGWSMNISSGLTPVRFCVRQSERMRTFTREKVCRRARDEELSIHTF